MDSINFIFPQITLGRMLKVLLLSFIIVSANISANDQCPADSFASIYENKIYQVRHITCLKKIKKKYVKHGSVSQYSFDGKLLKQEFYFNGKASTASAFEKTKSLPITITPKEIRPVAIPIRANKSTRIYLRNSTKYEIKNSDPQIVYFTYDIKLNQMLVTGAKPGQARLEMLGDDGAVLEIMDINVYPHSTEKKFVISGNNEFIFFFSQIKEKGILMSNNHNAAIIVDDKIEKVESWDQSLLTVISDKPVIRVKANKPGNTHLRLFIKGQSEFSRVDVSIAK